MIRRITIVGVGLIGGSLGLAIKHRFKSAVQVTGVDSSGVLRKARKRGAIDAGVTDIGRGVEGADLVLLAAPMAVILKLIPALARSCAPGTIVSDVGSVKLSVMEQAAKWFPAKNFVGGHPMAGVELSGIDAAHPLLFENAVYVLTPMQGTPRHSLKRLASFLSSLGARVILLDARTHDEVAAALSHLPQLTAVALMNVAGKEHPSARNHLRLAAGGFRDLTRIASSRFTIWESILPMNAPRIRRSLNLLIRELQSYSAFLGSSRSSRLRHKFRTARDLRNSIPKTMKGFVTPLAEVYVFVKDRPGMLARMTTALHRETINIKDIELMKIREGTGGTFRLAFESADHAKRASVILRKLGFELGS